MKKINGIEYSECPHENEMMQNYLKLKQRRREEARIKRAILIQKVAGVVMNAVFILGGIVLALIAAFQMFVNTPGA